jgi:hypothetical protein
MCTAMRRLIDPRGVARVMRPNRDDHHADAARLFLPSLGGNLSFDNRREALNTMSDTVKIERPLFSRRQSDIGGRVKLDSKGNVLVVKTRVSDMQTLPTLDPSGEPAARKPRKSK